MKLGYFDNLQTEASQYLIRCAAGRGVMLEQVTGFDQPLPENLVLVPPQEIQDGYFQRMRRLIAAHPNTRFHVVAPFRAERKYIEERLTAGGTLPNLDFISGAGPHLGTGSYLEQLEALVDEVAGAVAG
jgi:hypothetical protein